MCNLVYVPVRDMLNRAAPVLTRLCSVSALRLARSSAAPFMLNKGFCMLESSKLLGVGKIAGSVIPAICLTHETLGDLSWAG